MATAGGPPVTAAAVSQVRVGYGAYEVRYGLGRVWAATAAGVVAVDPTSGRVAGGTDIHSRGEWSNVAVGGGSVWFLGAVGTVVGLGPQSMLARRPIAVGQAGHTAFENVGASDTRVCAGRLARPSQAGVVCVRADGRGDPLRVRAGPGPLLGMPDGSIWIGGPSLARLAPGRDVPQTIHPMDGGNVVALAADGSALWAAVNRPDRPAELWRITGARVVRRMSVDTGAVASLAARRGRLWVIAIGRKSAWIDAVLPSGALVHVARVPPDSRSLAASPSALWTCRYRSGVVLEITQPA